MTELQLDPTAPTNATGCVVCHAQLAPQTHETLAVQACPNGHGLFLTDAALHGALHDRTADRSPAEEQAAEAAQGPIALRDIESTETARTCPVGGEPMTKQVFAYESGVPIDICREHGIWLDAGELERIEAWYEAQERHTAADMQEWGGQAGKLQQIEQEYEEHAAQDLAGVHWGPVGWITRKLSYAWMRRDDH